VTLVVDEGELLKVTATNLSEGGMAVHFEGKPAETAFSKVHFMLPGTRTIMEPKGEIAWADNLGRAGIRFVDVPEASRAHLERWIMQRLETEASSAH
jgi:hypothetical protein